jgi:hydroxyacid-oxoacid transhydrogenase
MVPHGTSLTAPEAFRYTFQARPDRHVRAAELLDPGLDRPDDAAEHLPRVRLSPMRDIGIPDGIGGVGYTDADVPELVEGTLKQQRLLATPPQGRPGRARRDLRPLAAAVVRPPFRSIVSDHAPLFACACLR